MWHYFSGLCGITDGLKWFIRLCGITSVLSYGALLLSISIGCVTGVDLFVCFVKYSAIRWLFIFTHAAVFYMNMLCRFRVKACLEKIAKLLS
jgi:hypothetical protein